MTETQVCINWCDLCLFLTFVLQSALAHFCPMNKLVDKENIKIVMSKHRCKQKQPKL